MMDCESGNVLSKPALGGVFGSGHANVHMGKAEACLPIEASPNLKRARPQCLRPPNARNLEMWHRTQRTNQTKPRSRNASDPLMPVMPILGLCNFDTQEKYGTELEAQTKPNQTILKATLLILGQQLPVISKNKSNQVKMWFGHVSCACNFNMNFWRLGLMQ